MNRGGLLVYDDNWCWWLNEGGRKREVDCFFLLLCSPPVAIGSRSYLELPLVVLVMFLKRVEEDCLFSFSLASLTASSIAALIVITGMDEAPKVFTGGGASEEELDAGAAGIPGIGT